MLTSLVFLAQLAFAGSLAGVTLPDSATVAGNPVKLNGLGLREKYFVDVYVAGLYLTTPTQSGSSAIAADEPKRVVMHFVYKSVTREQMIETFQEGFGSAPGVAAQAANIEKLKALVPAGLKAGDQLAFEYAPGVGTSMVLNGKVLGTIPGADFMKLVFGIYLGAKPPTPELKAGLLGA